MDFLTNLHPKILRSRLYGDQDFSRFELEILHTPAMQRLYNLKQLGFADRVFPDAVHGRFNHVLGATEVVGRMGAKLIGWLDEHGNQKFEYFSAGKIVKVSASQLKADLSRNMPVLRLMGLLHDLTHAAFGHTLEDEVNVFQEKHDSPGRQKRFFDGLIAQLLYMWCCEERIQEFRGEVLEGLSELNLSPKFKRELDWAEELAEHLKNDDEQRASLAGCLRELELAFRLLLHLDFAHSAGHEFNEPHLLVSDVIDKIDASQQAREFVLQHNVRGPLGLRTP